MADAPGTKINVGTVKEATKLGSLDAILTALSNNTSGSISPHDMRDMSYTIWDDFVANTLFGPTGAQGHQGEQGATGPDGSQGIQGVLEIGRASCRERV